MANMWEAAVIPQFVLSYDLSDPVIPRFADYDPSEPRDTSGEWTGEGGGTAVKDRPPPRPGMHHFDEAERETLKARKIVLPPAWKNIQVADDPTSDLQAIGHDSKGRSQYVYSAEHTARQAAAKFERIKAFHEAVDKLDDTLESDSLNDDTAAAVLVMRRMGLRPGSESDTKAEKSARGATNLRVGDVRVTPGGQMKLDFTGKDGVHIVLPVKDSAVEKAISARLEGKSKTDRLFKTNEGRAAQYLKSKTGGFKLKDLRTYHANDLATKQISSMRPPKNKKEFAQLRNKVGDIVCAQLGNTRSMALNSYINPACFSSWREKCGI